MAKSEKAQQFQNDIMAKITQAVIDSISTGTAPWQQPWEMRGGNVQPQNISTHKDYRGLNALYLSILGAQHGCDYWIGAQQGIKMGGKPLKNSKVYIMAPMMFKDKTHTNPDGSPKMVAGGFRIVGIHNVLTGFSGLEDRIPKVEPLEPRTLDAHMLDGFITGTGADVRHAGDHAFYSPATDYVQMPTMDQFNTPAGYYGTILHELTHWTGHKSRLDRLSDKSKRGYAFEELIAELGCYYASERLGCPNATENHKSYLENWLCALKSDTKYLWDAASKAQRAADWLIDKAHKSNSLTKAA